MQFLSRLRKREEAEPMIRVDFHKEIIAEYAEEAEAAQQSARLSDAALQECLRELQQERETVARLVKRNRELERENGSLLAKSADLAIDAEARRERLRRDREYHANRRSNLKQFRDQKAVANG